jgi:catechol 2,3-dioxygenase-like lactoylglutathione lyase family enzyme
VIGKSHHYGLTVSNLDESLEFYCGVLGMELVSRVDVGGDAFAASTGVPGASGEIAHLDGNGFVVELLQYDSPPGRNINDEHDPNDVGATHLAIEVEDIDVHVDELAPEVEFQSRAPPVVGGTGAKVAYVCDPDGSLVELIENPQPEETSVFD